MHCGSAPVNRRRLFFLCALALLALCIAIVLLFRTQAFVRGFVGDVLIVMLIYSACKALADFPSGRLALATLAFAFAVEAGQGLRLLALLGIPENLFTRLVFGAVFDAWDLLAYTIGVALIYGVDRVTISERP